MQKDTVIGIGVLVVILAVIVGYAALKPIPVTTPGTITATNVLPTGGYIEHAQYYDITADYATSTPLAEPANTVAVTLMQNFVSDTITQFKTDGNFDNLTAKDITVMGFDQGRKEMLRIMYLITAPARTVSYIFTTYADTLGAHGNMFFHTFTFDTKTGVLLSLADIFLPGTKYLDALSSISRAKFPAVIGEFADMNFIENGTTPDEKNFRNFFLVDRDLVILFDPYAVAPYAAGPQTLRIPLSELSVILKPEYR
ncbi:hypothetical protein A3A36_00660 [Candidatus Kaiserbacteria bacterium RIFCSPLOWO2_01_FULL_52_12b]|uniref:DUF3298 domain-containing protein n=1 Tax=Candidatus Kaiserbacteria bacterium RIFCSPLOWO2_01_FULL_52_12b TaxID=1798509 RepID=A0A1F6EX50_9BACT|nr:MAG: hypothetical protein A3A36_00660 [Candidatus Kaiserbacteria bacterium RIFCSPLOWO2_01_FULL_52_12b]